MSTCKHGALLAEDCDDCWNGPTGYVRSESEGEPMTQSETQPPMDKTDKLEACRPDLIAYDWAETLSTGEQDVLLTSSLRRLQDMINASRASVAAPPQLTESQEAYNQGVEDAKCAIRAESQGGGYWAATYINAIARRCSPHVYAARVQSQRDTAYADGYGDGFRQGKQSHRVRPKETCPRCTGSGFESDSVTPCEFCGGDGLVFERDAAAYPVAATVDAERLPFSLDDVVQQLNRVLGLLESIEDHSGKMSVQEPLPKARVILRGLIGHLGSAAVGEQDSLSMVVVRKAAQEPCRSYAKDCAANQPEESFWCAPCTARHLLAATPTSTEEGKEQG